MDISTCETKNLLSENNAESNYKCPCKPDNNAPRVRCKIYSNRAFNIANNLQTYRVYTFYLDGLSYFFSDSSELDESALSSLDKTGIFRHICMFFCLHYSKHRTAVKNRHQLAQNLIIQKYNKKPSFIRKLFSHTPEGEALRTAVRTMHRTLYSSGLFGRKRHTCYVITGKEFISIMERDGMMIPDDEECLKKQESQDEEIRRRKEMAFHSSPEFTYTLLPDGVLHLSRADTAIRNMASKHALQASCLPEVIFAGTCRFERRDEEQDIIFVIDNDSGTYAPKNDKDELARLKNLLEWNFPGLKVDAKTYVPPEMDDDDDDGEE